jgi:hypothetical protein
MTAEKGGIEVENTMKEKRCKVVCDASRPCVRRIRAAHKWTVFASSFLRQMEDVCYVR